MNYLDILAKHYSQMMKKHPEIKSVLKEEKEYYTRRFKTLHVKTDDSVGIRQKSFSRDRNYTFQGFGY